MVKQSTLIFLEQQIKLMREYVNNGEHEKLYRTLIDCIEKLTEVAEGMA